MSSARGGFYFVAGALFTGFLAWWVMAPPTVGRAHDEAWALPPFDYQDLGSPAGAGGDEVVNVEGTLMGDDVGWPVNTWDIHCVRSESSCEVAHVEEIGRRQLGPVHVEHWPVSSWTPRVIVLQSETGPTASCEHTTITIDRGAKRVEYLSVPENADKDFCRQARKLIGPARVEDWRIGNPKQPWD